MRLSLQSHYDADLAYVLTRLTKRQLSLRAIAAGSGVPYRTLEKIAQGVHAEPSVGHVDKLSTFFENAETV